MKTYSFDVELFTSLRVEAESEEKARQMIRAQIDRAEANFGSWPNGDPIVAEVGIVEDGIHLIDDEETEPA